MEYKIWSFKFIHYGAEKKKDNIVESVVDIEKKLAEVL